MFSEIEYWHFLIAIVFFVFGWLAARIDIRQIMQESRRLPKSYFEGLNFLLHEQPDRALEVFCQVVEVEPETVELHFALGNMFRARGEIERAIRIHQALVERQDLPNELKLQAKFELATDFLQAGILDRAENLFSNFANTHYEEAAQKNKLVLYQMARKWDKAIEQALLLPDFTMRKEIAQFHCLAAESCLSQGDSTGAEMHLTAAFVQDTQCIHAMILRGDIFYGQGEFGKALNTWLEIGYLQPEYFSLVADRVAENYRRLDDVNTGTQVFKKFYTRHATTEVLDALLSLMRAHLSNDDILAWLRKSLENEVRLSLLLRFIELSDDSSFTPEDWQLTKRKLQVHLRPAVNHACKQCGFKVSRHFWCCPACRTWDSVAPHCSELTVQ